ncbi:potassium voltage-gated channel protein Shaw-like [Ruditapes philippinarum]|uniref:potassium voltage-gated channel protein Shaw-like n=1 Tax=Ruditapes philippinarum TaxID=129788 RepID=UPI00295A8E0F|nr:potassium voltage-gated channel protein Shaw-like [Ruditapes philippinarum]
MDQNQVIELNVGGKLLTTQYSTLMKECPTRLSRMFENPEMIPRDTQCRIVIDFDGGIFVHVLNYLRTGSHPPKDKVLEVYECAEYFGIKSMVDALRFYQPVVRKNEITELKKTFDKEKYEILKQHAVAELNKKFHPEEDKFFMYVTSWTNKCGMITERDGKKFVQHSLSRKSVQWIVHSLGLPFYDYHFYFYMSNIADEPEIMRSLGIVENRVWEIPHYSKVYILTLLQF